MRINELLSETQHVDEGVGQFLGKAAGAVGGAIGGVQGALKGMKDIYGQKKDRVANVAQRNVQRAGGYRKPATTNAAPSPGGPTPTPPTAGTPPSTISGTEDPTALRAQAAELTQKADEIEKQAAAPVSGSDRPYVAPPSGRVEPTLDTPGAAPAAAAGAPKAAPAAAPAANYGSGQSQAPAPSKVNYSGIPKAAPLPQATPSQGAYSVKSAYGQPAPAAPPAPAAAPQFKGPNVNGLQVRNMGEGKKLKFRSNFLDMDL